MQTPFPLGTGTENLISLSSLLPFGCCLLCEAALLWGKQEAEGSASSSSSAKRTPPQRGRLCLLCLPCSPVGRGVLLCVCETVPLPTPCPLGRGRARGA